MRMSCRSTCLRYAINRLLSKTQAVAVIDCDLGQPEFTASGLLSLHIISSPVLSPPHLHLRRPELSFFLGDLSAKHMPQVLEACVGKLFAAYCRYRGVYSETGDQGLSSSTLEENVDSGGSGVEMGGYAALDEDPNWRYPLPLLVNTDGWVRGMGAEVLREVIRLVTPTHLLHITSEKNRQSIPIISELCERESRRAQTESNQDEEAADTSPTTTVFSLTPGRHSASRLAAQDMRDLRLVSYFLRDYLRLCQVSVTDDIYKGLCSVSIKNGAIVDPLGYIPHALATSMQIACPLDQACLRVLGQAMPPRLLLAAFNAALVGISFDNQPSGGQISTVRLRLPSQPREMPNDALEETTDMGNKLLSLAFILDDRSPAPCVGLGIVADVDFTERCMHIIGTEFELWGKLMVLLKTTCLLL